MKKIVTVVVLIATMLALTGCGNSINGNWKLTGGSAMAYVYDNTALSTADTGIEVIFSFSKDDLFSIHSDGFGAWNDLYGTWTEDEGNVVITVDGASVNCTCAVDGDSMKLSFPYNNATVDFTFNRTK